MERGLLGYAEGLMSDGRGTRSYQVRRERGLLGYGERVTVGWEESKEIIEEAMVDVS